MEVAEFTDHAERKIRQRNLKKILVEKVLKDPEYIVDSYSDRKVAYRKIGKLYLSVVFIKEGESLVVLTAHWDKDFKPERESEKN